MKNKNNENNIQVHELVNAIAELQERKGTGTYAHSYALGTLQALIDWHLKGYSDDLQKAVNDSYSSVKNEMDALDKGVHALQS